MLLQEARRESRLPGMPSRLRRIEHDDHCAAWYG